MSKNQVRQNKRDIYKALKILTAYLYASEHIGYFQDINEYNNEFCEKFNTPLKEDYDYKECSRRIYDGEPIIISDGNQCYEAGTYQYKIVFVFDKDSYSLRITFSGEITGYAGYEDYNPINLWSEKFNKTFTNMNIYEFEDYYRNKMYNFGSDKSFILNKLFDCF